MRLDDALEAVGHGRFHWHLLLSCGSGYLAVNGWSMAIILAEPEIEAEFGLPASAAGLLLTLHFVGQTCGSALWGPWADRRGRRAPLLASLGLAGLSGALAACCRSYGLLIACLLFAGVGAGGGVPVNGSMMAEFVPASRRGAQLALLSLFWALGALLVAAFAWAFIPLCSCDEPAAPNATSAAAGLGPTPCEPERNFGWRLVFLGLGVTNLLSLAWAWSEPESPAWLLQSGRHAAAIDVLRLVARRNRTPCVALAAGASLTLSDGADGGPSEAECDGLPTINSVAVAAAEPPPAAAAAESGASPSDAEGIGKAMLARRAGRRVPRCSSTACSAGVCSSGLRATTAMLALIWFLSNYGYGTFNSTVPSLLSRKGIGKHEPARRARLDLYRDTLIYAAASVPGALLGMRIVETRLGRRLSLALACVLLAGCLAAFEFVRNEAEVVAATVGIALASQTMYTAEYVYTPEVYPTAVRGTAVALVSAAARVAGFAAPAAGGALLSAGRGGLLVPISGFSIGATALLAAFLPIETRGRNLQ